jgi:hypothetical protein
MRARIATKLDLHRRAVARPQLVVLLQWVLVHATRPYYGAVAQRWMVDAIKGDVRRLLHDMADRGAFLFFGIASAADFGSPTINLRAVGLPYGETLVLEHDRLLSWIFAGGARTAGWEDPSELQELVVARDVHTLEGTET